MLQYNVLPDHTAQHPRIPPATVQRLLDFLSLTWPHWAQVSFPLSSSTAFNPFKAYWKFLTICNAVFCIYGFRMFLDVNNDYLLKQR
jgi:hypothetical protein